MRRVVLLFGILVLLYGSLNAQSFLTPDNYLINGYSKKITGLDYDYQSCIPGLRESMLLRATSGKDFIEWETEAVPSDITKKYATFIWVAALGSSPGCARMDLSVEGLQNYSFYTNGLSAWEVKGTDKSTLSFNSIMVDQNGDNQEYMVLKIPVGMLVAGKSLIIKVTGRQANLTSWYMTFKKAVKTGMNLNPFPAIIKKGSSQMQLVEAAIFYFGKESEAKIYFAGKLLENTYLKFGYNTVNLGLPPVSKPTLIELKIVAGDFSMKNSITIDPVKKWKIKLIQHTHTDIGYIRSQTEILAEHLRYIDYALDYCDATDNYPENAKFRWICEASWPVDEYLKCRPAS